MKVAFVVPRYGVEVRAGAEGAARLLAEHVVSDLGWEAEALTTCAVDIRTWADEYAPGSVDVNGVQVHRFRSSSGRHPDFDKLSETMMFVPRRATASDQERWIDQQGPRNPDLVDAVAATDADVVVFTPYLYHPTVRGIERVGRRAVLHPAAHEEPPLHLPIFRRVFGTAAGLAYYTSSEQRLVERTFAVASTRHVVLGLGIDDEVADGENPIDGPYFLYVGRIDDGKGTRLLTELFAAYKRRRPGPLRLVLAGSVLDRPPEHRDVVLTGEVDEATKWALYRGALGFVMPSAYESFSLVLMEAWECGVPALVNGASEVLREHCQRSSGGGVWFDSYATFEAALDRLVRDGDLRAAMGASGRRYVEEHYRWPALIARYRVFLEGVAERAH